MPVERLNQEELMRLLLIDTTVYYDQLTERGLSQEETEQGTTAEQ